MLVNTIADIRESQTLALYHEYTEMDRPREVDLLWDKLIIPHPKPQYIEENIAQIMGLYYENFGKVEENGIPNFMDVLSDVYFYNDNILREISLIELLRDSNDLNYLKYNMEELLDEAVTSWEEYLAYNYDMHSLDMYVYKVILSFNCVVSLDDSDVPLEILELEGYLPQVPDAKGTYIVAGHCMNILMVPFSVDMCATLYGETIYRSGDYQCQS